MADDVAIQRMKREKAEREYDAQVTQVNRIQAHLSAKSIKSQQLPMEEYRKWLSDKKIELAEEQRKLQSLKQRRAEARRVFNGWLPQYKEEWLVWPDEPGWWWNFTDGHYEILYFDYGDDKKLVISSGGKSADDYFNSLEFAPYWKYQEKPKKP